MGVIVLVALVIALLSFVLVQLVLKKGMKMKRGSYLLSAILSMLITPIVLMILFFTVFFDDSLFSMVNYDQRSWHENPEERYQMQEYIYQNQLFIGYSKHQMLKELGEPDSRLDSVTWQYSLGLVNRYGREFKKYMHAHFENDTCRDLSFHDRNP